MFTRSAILFAVALAAGAPFAGAWGSMGSHEPDTTFDDSGWMWNTTDITPSTGNVKRVYLNGFLGQCSDASCAPINPNVASLRTGVRGSEYLSYAILGVFKDCNADGFIGIGEQGLWEYRVTLLNRTDICPVQKPPTPIPISWNPTHNDGDWVHELIPIQWVQGGLTPGDQNPFNHNDNASRVWMDFGLPTTKYTPNCYYRSAPRGTFHSTGGILKMYDCPSGYSITDAFNSAMAADPALAPFSFADSPRDQGRSASALNQRNPWGEEEDASHAQVWDCSSPQLFSQSLGETGSGQPSYVNMSSPSTSPTVSAEGSAAGTMNATGSGTDKCHRRSDVRDGGDGGAEARRPYTTLGETSTLESSVRIQTDVMTPDERQRPAAPYAIALGRGSPPDLGVHQTPYTCFLVSCTGGEDGIWSGNRVYHIDNVFVDPATGTPAGASYVTTYAYVSPAAVARYGLTLPPGAVASTYGAGACGTATTGIKNGWDCDRTHWWKDWAGADIAPHSPYLGKDPKDPRACHSDIRQKRSSQDGCWSIATYVGDTYNLRDIDCYDASLMHAREQGVDYSIAGGSPCASVRVAPLV